MTVDDFCVMWKDSVDEQVGGVNKAESWRSDSLCQHLAYQSVTSRTLGHKHVSMLQKTMFMDGLKYLSLCFPHPYSCFHCFRFE